MRLALMLVLSASAAHAAPTIFRKQDGTVCVFSVENGQAVETCEVLSQPQPEAPATAAPATKPVLVPAQLPPAPAAWKPNNVDLIGSAANKFGWSGGLKVTAVTSGIGSLIYFGLDAPVQGGISMGVAAISGLIAFILDQSALDDLRAAGATGG
jgi:hypothetical protein